ncbi:MAG: magnesium chelatase, partial [Chloroflexi bacterium]|nr:magnesium chelatase [Chloroflexota bacterium]
IITPLKDRFGSEIRTHYPQSLEHEMSIVEQERTVFADEDLAVSVPGYMKEVIAEVTHLARKHPDISQRSGVSVRVSICNYENVVSNATRRAIRLGERQVTPRVSDLTAVLASTSGKVELEAVGEVREERIVDKLVQGAVTNVFNRYFKVQEFEALLRAFDNGLVMETSETMPAMEYVRQALEVDGLKHAVAKLGAEGNPPAIASAVELVLEGLHLSRKLNKDRQPTRARYRR